MNILAKKIEGILFFESEAISLSELVSLTADSEDNIKQALIEINEHYKSEDKNIALLSQNDSYLMAIIGSAREIILTRESKEREGEISKAGLETLSAILYLNGGTKSQIDYIRGVQSGYMLRILASRGLIARSSKIGRDVLYVPTVETLRFLGINSIEELPEYLSTSKILKEAIAPVQE